MSIVSDQGVPANAANLYRSILSAHGYLCIAAFRKGLSKPPDHTFYAPTSGFLDGWIKEGQRFNIYHGCAVYKDGTSRKQDNVLAVKALWIDLDAGPGKAHSDAPDALARLDAFCARLDLARPWIVLSGGGVHAYFAFAKAIAPEHWDKLAALFAAVMDHAGLKHDSSRTTDSASILRVPGTLNFKTDPPRPVVLLQEGVEESAQGIYRKLKDYADANGVLVASGSTKPRKTISKENADLIGTKDYPPSHTGRIVQRCAVLREVDETGGDVPFPIWRPALGVAKHTITPETTAARWTRNRASTGHDKYDHVKALDDWSTGPTTCEEFAKHTDKCKSCEHRGQVASPIRLGEMDFNEVHALPLDQQAQIEEVLPGYVRELNARFAQVRVGAGYVVLDLQTPFHTANGVARRAGFLELAAFRQRCAGQTVMVDGKLINKASAWLCHPMRRQYEGLAFAPDKDLGPTIFNMWQGFGVCATVGNVSPWLELLQALIPQPVLQDFVLCWLAWKVQNPGGVPGTIVIVTGGKGVGKNSLFEPIVACFGAHGAVYDDAEQVAGGGVRISVCEAVG